MDTSNLPVVVIGAGPVGMAAAAHLVARGETPLVLEAGPSVGSSVLEWAHVQIFSPWQYDVDGVAGRMLEDAGWTAPPAGDFPTGRELVDLYLQPLAELPAIQPHIRLNTRVTAVTRYGLDKMKDAGRAGAPFLLHVESPSETGEILAKAVIDASGTWTMPNPLGVSGLPARGEAEAASKIMYGIPDATGVHRERYAGKRVLVVGSGHSAFNALNELVQLQDDVPQTSITWAIRGEINQNVYGGGESDALPERGALGQMVQNQVRSGRVALVTGFRTTAIDQTSDGIILSSDNQQIGPIDEIVAATGFRPNLSMLNELRLDLDPAVESPRALAPLIDPNIHSCGTVRPHGAVELAQPEPDFYIAGMKSYGRAPTFLMLTGYEQVRSIAAAIVGDWAAARDVQLVLPETGVCSGPGGDCCGQSASDGGCCTIPEQPIQRVSTLPVLQLAGVPTRCC